MALVIEFAGVFFPQTAPALQAYRLPALSAVALVSLLAFVIYAYEANEAHFSIPTTNTRLTLKFGDLFAEPADLLIAVNEFFDGEIGPIVAAQSVHGQFISRYYQANATVFRQAADQALAQHEGQTVPRVVQPSISYPIGTTIKLPIGAHDAYLVALSYTDLTTHKASTDIAKFWLAVTDALEYIHHFNNGTHLAMPLIGNGRSSLNLPAQDILRLLVLAVTHTARRMQLPDQMTIVISEDCFDHIDLRQISLPRRA